MARNAVGKSGLSLTKASHAEQPMALERLDQLEENRPLLLETAENFMGDRGYDDSKLHRRLDVSFGFENHTIRGRAKMKLRVSMGYMAMLAMALGR